LGRELAWGKEDTQKHNKEGGGEIPLPPGVLQERKGQEERRHGKAQIEHNTWVEKEPEKG